MSGDDTQDVFQKLVDFASELQQEAPRVKLSSIPDARVRNGALYKVNGTGLWRLESDDAGVTLIRLFYGGELRLTWTQWYEACVSEHVLEVSE